MNKQVLACAPRTNHRFQPIRKPLSFGIHSHFLKSLLLGVIILMSNSLFAQYTLDPGGETWTSVPATGTKPGWEDGIIMNAGDVFTIQGTSGTPLTLTFNYGSGVVIAMASGCHLITEHVKLTCKNTSTDNIWGGIIAGGVSTINAYSTEPDPQVENDATKWSGVLNTSQTFVELKTGTIIDNAQIGVHATGGATVRARKTTFTDNAIGIKFDAYTRTDASFVMDCDFNWTKNNVTNFTGIQKVHIDISNVKGINIGGSNFSSTMPISCPEIRGIGIRSTGAAFTVGKSGDRLEVGGDDTVNCPENTYTTPSLSKRCIFSQLYKGILFQSGLAINHSFVVRQSTFNHNYNAIETASSSNTKIYKCRFSSTRSILNSIFANTGTTSCSFESYSGTETMIDIFFNDAQTYEVFDNTFDFVGSNVNHIQARSRNLNKCRLQQNVFTNSLSTTIATANVIGIHVIDKNSFLEIYCNTFNNMGTDIKIDAGATVINPLGSSGRPAMNVFSALVTGRVRIDNSVPNTFIDYWFLTGILAVSHNPNAPSVGVTDHGTTKINEIVCDLKCGDFYTGINDFNLESLVSIFPVPTSEVLNISTDLNVLKSIKIYNQLGQIVYSFSKSEFIKSHQIDVSAFNSGIYYVILDNKAGLVRSKKIIIAH